MENHFEGRVNNMKRIVLYQEASYIIVQHSHYPVMKIYRKNPLTIYHIQKFLAYQRAFDLTNIFFIKD